MKTSEWLAWILFIVLMFIPLFIRMNYLPLGPYAGDFTEAAIAMIGVIIVLFLITIQKENNKETEKMFYWNQHEIIFELAIIIACIFIITGNVYDIKPFENIDMNRPIILPLMGVIIIIVLYSWWCCGSDHEENVSTEYPDGWLTYPGDEEWETVKREICNKKSGKT